jgi:hypothetical protein
MICSLWGSCILSCSVSHAAFSPVVGAALVTSRAAMMISQQQLLPHHSNYLIQSSSSVYMGKEGGRKGRGSSGD